MTPLVISGLGVITRAAKNPADLWRYLLAGEADFDLWHGALECDETPHIAARMRSGRVDQAASFLRDRGLLKPRHEVGEMLSLYVCLSALEDAEIDWSSHDLRRCAVVIGNLEPNSRPYDAVEGREMSYLANSHRYHTVPSYSLAHAVSAAIGAEGPSMTIHNTCASGNNALEIGASLITEGLADIVVVGGVDAFSDRIFSGFATLGVLGDQPCKPFSPQRKFVTIGDGGVAVVLQRADDVVARAPYARLVAVASNNDAKHPTNLHYDGVLACHQALWERSGHHPEEIGAVFAHGTGSVANDNVEGSIFSEHYPSAQVYGVKAMTGHLMGAAAAMGLVGSCLAMRMRKLPPNLYDKDDKFAFHLPTAVSSLSDGGDLLVQNNAFGFGGINAIALLGAAD